MPPKSPKSQMTPIRQPKDASADALAKHIASLAERIKKVLTNPDHKSVTAVDKKEIVTLTQAITDATKKITTVMDAQTVVSNINATDLLSSVKEEFAKLRQEIALNNTQTSYASVASKSLPRVKTPVSRPAIVISSVDANHKHSDV